MFPCHRLVHSFCSLCSFIIIIVQNCVLRQSQRIRRGNCSAKRFADRLVYYLLQKIQTGPEKAKLGAISTLRHLINAAGPFTSFMNHSIPLKLLFLYRLFTDQLYIRNNMLNTCCAIVRPIGPTGLLW